MLFALAFATTVLGPLSVRGACPFTTMGTPPSGKSAVPSPNVYSNELGDLDVAAVFNDLYALMSESKPCWPADEFNGEASYGPLFIRLAWHCSGSYRATDGLGGCAGGRQRFQPESAWPDNTNLDKARALLYPIKEKYGDALSWGDLFVFSGTAAIAKMGGPIAGVCAGRIDDADGTKSAALPFASDTADDIDACNVDGDCTAPLGSDTIGLIYVNPAGVLGDPVPAKSAARIREVFGRMDFDDREVVALIGGGHAFGKCHGACASGPGDGPDVAPNDPWPSTCGVQTVTTSGFEGAWTSTPLRWSNEFFTQLINDNYTLVYNNDNPQWQNIRNGLLMLTTDLALVHDADYSDIVAEFAEDIEALDTAFAAAWQKLTEAGDESGWAANKFCVDASVLRSASSYAPPTSRPSMSQPKSAAKSAAKSSRGINRTRDQPKGYSISNETGIWNETAQTSSPVSTSLSKLMAQYMDDLLLLLLASNLALLAYVCGACSCVSRKKQYAKVYLSDVHTDEEPAADKQELL